jgi:DNA-binding NarL/FixJ family response regulator
VSVEDPPGIPLHRSRRTDMDATDILIVDDHPLMRLGIAHQLRQRWPDARLREAGSVAEALSACRQARPTLVLLDLNLPDAAGSEGLAKLLRAADPAPVLVLSLQDEATHAERLLAIGAAGFVEKQRAAHELVAAVERVLAGRRYVSDTLAERLLERREQGGAAPAALHERLSEREYRVLLLLAEGRSVADIGQQMNISPKTASTYRARIMAKAGWTNNAELVRYCVAQGLIDP